MASSISTIIPVYNRSDLLHRALHSIVIQTHPVDEIVVVDNGSEEDLKVVLQDFDHNITYIRHDKNLGAAAARNTGIKKAKGTYVAFLDSDDVWHPEKIEKQLAYHQANKDILVSTTGFNLEDAQYAIKHKPRVPAPEIQSIEHFVWGCFLSPGSTMMVHRDIFKKVGFFDTSYERLEDWDWLLRLGMKEEGRVYVLQESLSTIYLGGKPAYLPVKRSLAHLQKEHLAKVRAYVPSLVSKFKAGICLEEAYSLYNNKKLATSLYKLVKANIHSLATFGRLLQKITK